MTTVGLIVRLEATPGWVALVADFRRSAGPLVEDAPATLAWFALRLGAASFAIVDAFPDEGGRQAHLTGAVAAALAAKADELFAQPPVIERVDVLADVLRAAP